jgi:hypothetical protein
MVPKTAGIRVGLRPRRQASASHQRISIAGLSVIEWREVFVTGIFEWVSRCLGRPAKTTAYR